MTPAEEAARERAAKHRAMLKEHLPECEGFIRDLYELGLIPGWRAIASVTVTHNKNNKEKT